MLKVKLLQDHSKDCVYVTHPNLNHHSPWFFDTYTPEKHLLLSRAGDKRGNGSRWIEVKCAHSSKCQARAIIRVDSIEDAVQEAITE